MGIARIRRRYQGAGRCRHFALALMAGLPEIHAIAQNSRRNCYHWRRRSPCCHAAAAGTTWWIDLTARGGEGMVVRLCDSTARGRRSLVQPAAKSRGREYLRIYGSEYTLPEHIERLRRLQTRARASAAARIPRTSSCPVRTSCFLPASDQLQPVAGPSDQLMTN